MTVSVVAAGPAKISRSAQVSAAAAEIFEFLADPRRHSELDGSGTVVGEVTGPDRLALDSRFTVKMRQHRVPYRITSRVTGFTEGRLLEWQHPLGHRWRWELSPVSDTVTLVTETFDYSGLGAIRASGLQWSGLLRQNEAGIEATLRRLQAKYQPG